MKCFIVLSALAAVALARPGHLLQSAHSVSHVIPVAYAKLEPGAPIGHDGRVVDTPEVAHAKAEHLAAHAHEKAAQAHESHDSADLLTYAAAARVYVASNAYAGLPAVSYHHRTVAPVAYAKQLIVPAAPIGHDGRVVDTPEVAHAKAEHLAAHAHEKAAVARESHNSAEIVTYVAAPVATSYQTYASLPVATGSYHGVGPVAYAKLVPSAPIGHDGRVVDTPEVAHAKAAHEAAHAHEKLNLALAHDEAAAAHSYAPYYVSAAHQW